MNRGSSRLRPSEHNTDAWQNPLQHSLGQSGHNRPPCHAIQLDVGFSAVPHMPGASRYLKQREDHDRQAFSATQIGSTARPVDENGERSKPVRLATVHTSKQSFNPTGSLMDTLNHLPPQNRYSPPTLPMETSNPLSGTQHAPLQISSSPEPEAKRRKTTNKSQAVHSNSREHSDPTGLQNYDGFSRQDLTKMLADSTNVKPSKVRYYAVALGRRPGVYLDWPSAEKQVHGFVGAKHKKFKVEEDALAYVKKYQNFDYFAHSAQVSPPTAQRSVDSEHYSLSTIYESMQPSLLQADLLNADHALSNKEPVFVPDYGPKLVPEQQHVVDLIMQGHNVFYTGSAGCGKSTILKAFVGQLQQRGRSVKIIAPTNLAALNVGGQTTWNFAGWTPDSMKIRIDKLMETSRGKESWKKFDRTDVLVIDEISMIENLQFERLNMILKASRGEKYGGGAFGGMQLIVTGDVSAHRCMTIDSS